MKVVPKSRRLLYLLTREQAAEQLALKPLSVPWATSFVYSKKIMIDRWHKISS